jgi:hypothetical protein
MPTGRCRIEEKRFFTWPRLAALLPDAEDVDMVQGCWDIGAPEAGLHVLVDRLTELRPPVGESAWVEIAVMAEQWGVWDQRGAEIAGLVQDAARPARLRILDGYAEAPLPARTVLSDPRPRVRSSSRGSAGRPAAGYWLGRTGGRSGAACGSGPGPASGRPMSATAAATAATASRRRRP